jgi:NAD(P)H-dependent FMN reductase
MIKVVGLNGSLRAGSHSRQALALAIEKAKALGAEAELLDLQTLTLPFCDGGDEYPGFPDVKRLRNTVKQADALILATPEYHGTMSGVLKNALDLMGFDELSGKMTAHISVLGGQVNNNALNDLRTTLRWVHAWTIPEQVAIGQAWNAFDEQGHLKDARLAKRLEDLVAGLIKATKLMQADKAVASLA